jgi:hypothetical protein
MQLEFYRVFVTPTEQLTILSDVSTKYQAFVFALEIDSPIRFQYLRNQYALVKEKEVKGSYIIASLGKKSTALLHKSPEEGFNEEKIEDWPTVPVFISLSNSPTTGQAIAIGTANRVLKKPLPILEALADTLSGRIRPNSFELNVNAISRTSDFWDVVSENKENIENITFTFTAPNLFNANDQLDKELKAASETLNATHLTIGAENKAGGIKLTEEQNFTKRAVEYISGGGGQYSMKIKGLQKKVKDGEYVKSVTIDEVTISSLPEDEEKLKQLCDNIFSCLDSSE